MIRDIIVGMLIYPSARFYWWDIKVLYLTSRDTYRIAKCFELEPGLSKWCWIRLPLVISRVFCNRLGEQVEASLSGWEVSVQP